MIRGKYELTIALGVSAYPAPTMHEGADNVELPKKEAMAEMPKMKPVTHYLEVFEDKGVVKAIHQTELSKQLVDDLIIGDNCISWKSYSGSEGVDLWQYCLAYNEVSDDIAGVSFGMAPFFRGYMVVYGKKVG